MESIGVFCLHGFLGHPDDWQILIKKLNLPASYQVVAPFLFAESDLSPRTELADWGKKFCQYVESFGYSKNILIGYSLGGRLAFYALHARPELFNQVIILSANPDPPMLLQDKDLRLAQDRLWATKFIHSPWSEVLHDWNQQAVFAESVTEPTRLEKTYSRELLSLALENWSLARQDSFLELLKTHQQKIFWFVGSRDKKYLQIARTLFENKWIRHLQIIEHAGHRVFIDQPQRLADSINEIFFKK